MAIDDPGGGDGDASSRVGGRDDGPATVGSYSWSDFRQDVEDAARLDAHRYLGFAPEELTDRLSAGADAARELDRRAEAAREPGDAPVAVGLYSWEDFKVEYYYDEDGEPPRETDGDPVPFDPSEYLGFDPAETGSRIERAKDVGDALDAVVDRRSVDVPEELDEDEFFSTREGHTTVVNRYDLEKAVPVAKKTHFVEENRYWVNKPYACVVIFHSRKENEKKYYVVEPYTTEIEADLREFLSGKLRTAIKYSEDDVVIQGGEADRASVIERETFRLLDRYDLYDEPAPRASGSPSGNEDSPDDSAEPERGAEPDDGSDGGLFARARGLFSRGDGEDDPDGTEPRVDDSGNGSGSGSESEDGREDDGGGLLASVTGVFGPDDEETDADGSLDGIAARPEPAVLAEDSTELSEYQVEKLLYELKRNFIGYARIDPVKHDINVEDISCDGYNSRVFVYHTDYEQIISNVEHGEEELDDFVVKLAQRSGKGISKRQPQVDATLPDGSRAQLTLGDEVSDHGTNYTIRQFKDVPFTPIDLISWNTFNLDEMAFLWLCIENHKSLIFAGGTASGKTTSLNAVSLFIPSNAKIVSIEDTREVELPQRNWVASVTRPSFGEDDKGDVDEFDLLEAALRQRPDYIVMGEVRGEEGRTLFQVMSTGHTTYTTFHADSVGEVIKRFTTEPINVSKTLFTALDLVSIQTQTRVDGHKVRRNKTLTEINEYTPENDEINVRDVYEWRAETDAFLQMGSSNTLEEIKFDRGWSQERLDEELFKRKVVLAYLIQNGLNTYSEVAASVQAFINDPDTILTIVANDGLERSLEDLREMESVQIEIDPEKEEMVPRPDPNEELVRETAEILDNAAPMFDRYREKDAGNLVSALDGMEDETESEEMDFSQYVPEAGSESEADSADGEGEGDSGPGSVAESELIPGGGNE